VAHGGTIFLDEIGEVSAATQVKLLRVLDTSTFRHVGGTREIRVDVRVIAATHRDLEPMVRQGLIREDLYYRLSTITLKVPALRQRRADVVLLAEYFTAQFNARFGFSKRIGPDAMAREYPALLEAGCNIVGACCGSNPEHIRRIAAVVRGRTRAPGRG